jgi:hypothetical protein
MKIDHFQRICLKNHFGVLRIFTCLVFVCLISSCTVQEGVKSQSEVFSLVKERHLELEKLLSKIDWEKGTSYVLLKLSKDPIGQALSDLGVLRACL